ncbi:PAS domain-containing protein [Roseomonas sp. GCM10028921]
MRDPACTNSEPEPPSGGAVRPRATAAFGPGPSASLLVVKTSSLTTTTRNVGPGGGKTFTTLLFVINRRGREGCENMLGLASRMLLVTGIALLPALALQTVSHVEAYKARQESRHEEARRIAILLAAEQAQIIDGGRQLLKALGRLRSVREGNAELCTPYLTAVNADLHRYSSLTAFDRDGQIICSSRGQDREREGREPSIEDRARIYGTFALGERRFDVLAGTQVIELAEPFKDANGEVLGVVTAELKLSWLQSILDDYDLSPGMRVTVTDPQGSILARRPSDLAAADAVGEGSATEVVYVAEFGAASRFGPAVGKTPGQFIVRVAIERRAQGSLVDAPEAWAVAMVLVSTVLALILARLGLGWMIWKPVVRLLQTAKEWRDGDLSARTGLREDGSEMGQLGAAFDAVAAAAQSREFALRAAKDTAMQDRARLAAIYQSAPVGLALLDPDIRFVEVNERLAALTGLPRQAHVGRRVAEVVPALARRIQAICREVLETGREIDGVEIGEVHPEGQERAFLVSFHPVRDPKGSILGINVSVLEITEQKRALAATEIQARRLEERVTEEISAREVAQARAAHAERMQALGQLAGGIAHDFNNVLQSVEGGATLIDRKAGDVDLVRRYARLILTAVRRGSGITRRLLSFARRGELVAELVEPRDLLHDMKEVLGHTLGTTISLRVVVPPGLPDFLADRSQLEAVLVNLSTNARDAMPGGGELVFEAREETVGTGFSVDIPPGRYLRILVSDTGEGMEQATLARAMEPFFTTKSKEKGTGLGLSMAKGFAEQSGGGLHVASEPGRGTVVSLWFPVATEGPKVAEPGQTLLRAARRRRVLLTDDQPIVLETLSAAMEEAGFSVVTASDGREALDLLEGGLIVDTLVSDLSMPRMSGYALIAAAKDLQPSLVAVLITGNAAECAELTTGDALPGSFALLRKPLSPGALVDQIEAMFATREIAAPH